MSLNQFISSELAANGLLLRGALNFTDTDEPPRLTDGSASKSLVMIGHAGSHMWPHFTASIEADDGTSNPLDRWSQRIIAAVAGKVSGRVIMPSEGPPYWPFQTWAKRCEIVWTSPIGPLIHPDYGLWHGYRGAIALPVIQEVDEKAKSTAKSPCETCRDQPCLSACPVGALKPGAYDVPLCRTHLHEMGKTAPCFEAACLARAACPIGEHYRYQPAHARFHTEAFARPAR